MAGSDKKTKIRLLVVLGAFTALMLALLGRAFWIQILMGEQYQKASTRQQFKTQTISSNRGMIYDRNGNELAINIPVVTISVDPTQLKTSELGADPIAETLAKELQLSKEEVLKKLQQPVAYQVIKRKVDKETGDKIKQWATENKVTGIYTESDIKRYYPDNNLASHVIGFTGLDNQGLSGIELSMEQYLKGQPGLSYDEVDAGGRVSPLNEEKRFDAQDGLNVVLTIDENIQGFAEKALQKAIEQFDVLQGGTAIVMDPRNGDILAMVSKPDFNLNDPYGLPSGVAGLNANQWAGLKSEEKVKKLQETVWRTSAINNTYEPGSTFKAISAAAFLEEGIVNPNTEVIDEPVHIAGWTIYCSFRPGHGRETFREAMYNSCNPVFVKLSQILGIDRFYKYTRAFGFYEKTGINLPGESDSIMFKKLAEIDMAVASFGQGLQVTPMQMVTSYAAIANGGKLVKPRLVKELIDAKGTTVKKFEPEVVRNVISKQTSSTLLSIMEGVVAKGTGKAAYTKGYRVAGKTGTSETFENGVRSTERYIASFAAIAPADDPVLSVLVILDHPNLDPHIISGGSIAGPVTSSIIRDTLEYLGVEKRYTEQEVTTQETLIPDVKYRTLEEAEKLMAERGLEYKIVGSGSKDKNAVVARQLPIGGDVLSKVTTVMLYTNKNDKDVLVKMPDLLNKPASQVMQELADAGLNIRAKGTGIAHKQGIAAGTEVPTGTPIEVEFW